MKKRSFILLEVIIAISIAGIALVWMMKSTSSSMQKQLQAIHKIDSERLMEVAFFDALLMLKKQPQTDLDIQEGENYFRRKLSTTRTRPKTDKNNIDWQQITIETSFPKLSKKDKFVLVYSKKV